MKHCNFDVKVFNELQSLDSTARRQLVVNDIEALRKSARYLKIYVRDYYGYANSVLQELDRIISFADDAYDNVFLL